MPRGAPGILRILRNLTKIKRTIGKPKESKGNPKKRNGTYVHGYMYRTNELDEKRLKHLPYFYLAAKNLTNVTFWMLIFQ